MSKSQFEIIVAVSLKTGVALLPLMMAGAYAPAYAQPAPATPATAPNAAADEEEADQDTKAIGAVDKEDKDDDKAVVVTGTSIRNAPPTGTNLISIDKEGIKATGANSASDLLSQLPQVGGDFFNNLGQLGTFDTGGVSASDASNGGVGKPDARGIPLNTQLDTGGNTLVLLDGQRMSGNGVSNSATDPNVVPVALLERVEVNTDGGSSIYGSDAIGGVINFITRRKFDGIQVRGRYGIADDYYNYEVGGIVGHTFGRASAYISFSRTGNDDIFNRERDYYRSIDWNTGLEIGTQCFMPNVRTGASPNFTFYGVNAAGTVSNTPNATAVNLCTPDKDAAFVGRNKRNNALASFSFDFSDDIKLTVRGRYADSNSRQIQAPYNASGTITPTNPYFQPIVGAPNPNANQTVFFSFGPVDGIGIDNKGVTGKFRQYGISPELTVNIDDNWQARGFVNWEKSRTERFNQSIDSAAVTTALASNNIATALNPYNVESSNAAVLADITSGFQESEARNEILNARLIVDGALFELPGGKVRMAVGAEYLKDKFAVRNFNAIASGVSGIDATPLRRASRDVKSVFGELNIPIVSSLNSGPLFEELRFAFSGRYDKFSDFGDNFSPRIGATYAPFKWLRLRGNWGKSFRAPTVIDTLNSTNINAAFLPGGFLPGILIPSPALGLPAQATVDDAVILYNGATNPGLRPQTGTNWSIAGELRPFAGLRAELSYFKIDYRDAISFLNFVGIYPTYLDFVTFYPNAQQIADFLAPAQNAQQILDQVAALPPGAKVYQLIDGRTTNMGNAKIEGLDYSARYDFNTPLGQAYISANGTIQLVSKFQLTSKVPFADRIAGTPNHRTAINVGLRSGGFRTQFTLNHTDGYKVTRSATLLQDRVSAYNVVNAFFGYEFTDGELGLGKLSDGLEVTLNIQNLFDTDPPVFRSRGGIGTTNGSTLGRLIQIGLRKDF
jgi:iron complex outermembrane receptor protein